MEEAIILALIAIVGIGALTVLQNHVSDALTSLLASLGVLDPGGRHGGS